MKCKICTSETRDLFESEIMNKYIIKYYQCTSCRFIQTEEPYWLEEAYEDAIAETDLGYVTRNIMFSEMNSSIIKLAFNKKAKFLDYGGGYGMFVRLMRNRGFDFYRQDVYCENLFSRHFDIEDIDTKSGFEMLTAYEVFEHLPNPIEEIENMLKFSDSILFSTQIQLEKSYKSVDDWWYFTPETGQHVALYSKKSLQFIADKYNLNLYTNGRNYHLLTKKKLMLNPVNFVFWTQKIVEKLLGRHFFNSSSLLDKDMDFVKAKLKDQKVLKNE